MSLGNNILNFRKKNSLSQKALAEKVGVTRQTISNWERDLSIPNNDQIISISKFLNVSIYVLLDQDIKKNNDSKLSANIKSKKKYNMWNIGLLILGSPLWLSFLIVIIIGVLLLYIVLWTLIGLLWVLLIVLLVCSFASLGGSLFFAFENKNIHSFAMIGIFFFSIGLLSYWFLACKIITKGMVLLTRHSYLIIKDFLSKREVNNETYC